MAIRRPRMLVAGCAFACVFAVTGGLVGQVGRDEKIARVEQGLLPQVVSRGLVGKPLSIAERMAHHGIPGMSMAVIDDGRIAWARAYGVRQRDGVSPVTPDTLFQAASLSKSVSALGALVLVQQRRVDLDGDVRQWLRSWRPEQTISLRQLLSHTAGLTVSGFSGYERAARLPTVTQILNGDLPANSRAVRVASPPGTQVRYSGGGYVALQQLIMDVTQRPFEEYMEREIFLPLKMTRSRFEQPLSPGQADVAASGHRRDGSKLQDGWMVHPELAAAGLWTTPTDLARMMIELQDALGGKPTQILRTASAGEILTGRIDNAGFGVFLTGPNGSSRRFTHSGRNAGFDSLLVGYKNGRQGAVVMINRNNNEGFIEEVIASVAREYNWSDYLSGVPQREYEAVPPSLQAPYAGVYEASDRPPLVVVFEGDKLFARSGEDAWFRLYPASETTFFATANQSLWTFVKSAGGTVSELIARTRDTEVHRQRAK